jgi:poly-beta-1,6-N-acetyl-D-glucosamine N-deacetylase
MKIFEKYKYKKFAIGFVLTFLFVLVANWFILNLTAPRIPILGFHSIVEKPASVEKMEENYAGRMEYSKQELSQFLEHLLTQNFWFLSSQEMYDYFITKSQAIPNEKIDQRPIMLSFDDSYKSYYTILLPLLENLEKTYKKKVKVVLFLNPGFLAKDETKSSTRLVCGDLREGFRKGFYDIQSHGQNHKNLAELTEKDLVYELVEAQNQLRKCTEGLDKNKTVASHIAYPFGAVNNKVEAVVAKYYLSGYLYNSRIFKLGWLRSPYQVPRLSVNYAKKPASLIKMAETAMKVMPEKNP